MTDQDKLTGVRERLVAEGYDGLMFPGECACCMDDLAPCGMTECDDGEDWINGCDAGYKHTDPKRPEFWVISFSKQPPTQQRFDEWYEGADK